MNRHPVKSIERKKYTNTHLQKNEQKKLTFFLSFQKNNGAINIFFAGYYKRLSKINHPMIKMYRFTNIHIHFFSHLYEKAHKYTRTEREKKKRIQKANQMNHGICFFRSLQWHILCGFFYFYVVVDSLVTCWHTKQRKIGIFKVKKNRKNRQMIFIHGN